MARVAPGKKAKTTVLIDGTSYSLDEFQYKAKIPTRFFITSNGFAELQTWLNENTSDVWWISHHTQSVWFRSGDDACFMKLVLG